MLKIVKAKGPYLYDVNGKEYIDCTSLSYLGYGIEELTCAISEAANVAAMNGRYGMIAESEERLRATLYDKINKDDYEIMVYATHENAYDYAIRYLSIAANYKENNLDRKIVTCSGANYNHPKSEYEAPTPYCYQCPFGKKIETCALYCAQRFKEAINSGYEKIIVAFISEPISSHNPSVVQGPPGYYESIYEICKENGILFVADERVTGGGRTGQYFAFEHTEVSPDFVIVGNGLSGGYLPIGALLIKKEFSSKIKDKGYLLETGGNSIACAAANSAIELIYREGIIANSKWIGDFLLESLKTALRDFHFIGEIRGYGLYIGIDIVHCGEAKSNFSLGKLILSKAMKNGLIISITNNSKLKTVQTIICAAPLTSGEREVGRIIDAFVKTMKSAEKILSL